ncbi:MAG: GNAT family N-acetyltransferase [Ilumatobacteraceae bacterium]
MRALLDSPTAYGSTYDREFAFVDSDWQIRLARADAATFLCVQDDGIAVGLVTGAIDDDSSDISWLLSMWVDAKKRGGGIAGQLIDEVVAWSRLQNCKTLRLQVTKGNTSAERAYEKRGFRRTGVTEIRERDQVVEFEMELFLD